MANEDGQLELRELRRRFGDTIALDGLEFTVPRCLVSGFLRPNGAGKTTAIVRQVLRSAA